MPLAEDASQMGDPHQEKYVACELWPAAFNMYKLMKPTMQVETPQAQAAAEANNR